MVIEALAWAQWASFAMIGLKVSLRFPGSKSSSRHCAAPIGAELLLLCSLGRRIPGRSQIAELPFGSPL